MMISEQLGLALALGRPARRRSLPQYYAPLFSRGRRGGGLLPKTSVTGATLGRADRHAGAVVSCSVSPSNEPLVSLADGPLARRFHAWNGHSGRRYICSVFPASAEEPQASLPDFVDAIVIAVAVAADGLRSPLAIFESGGAVIDKVSAGSLREWHVHLLATDAEVRRKVILDLAHAWFGDKAVSRDDDGSRDRNAA